MIRRTLRRMGDALRAVLQAVEDLIAIVMLLLAIAIYRDELLKKKVDDALTMKED